MKLFTRYNRYLISIISLLFLLSIIISYFLIRNVLQSELDEVLERTHSRLINHIHQTGKVPYTTSFRDQEIVYDTVALAASDSGFSSSTYFIPEQNKLHLSRKLVKYHPINKGYLRITIIEPLEGTRHLTILLAKIAISTTFLLLLLQAIVNRQLISKLLTPFYDSINVMKSFKVNSLTPLHFPDTNIEEFNLMNHHFQTATEKAIHEYKMLKEFNENASHEIQTPLAIIRSKLEILAQQESISSNQSELLEPIFKAVTRLSRLQQSLLLLTKIENNQFLETTALQLNEAVFDKINEFDEIWKMRNIHPSIHLENSVLVANEKLIDTLLENLLSNATRHNLTNGTIQVTVRSNELSISNTGPAVSLDPSRIFTRFYKENSNAENTGLGLSIIKQICDASAITISYSFTYPLHTFNLQWDKQTKSENR